MDARVVDGFPRASGPLLPQKSWDLGTVPKLGCCSLRFSEVSLTCRTVGGFPRWWLRHPERGPGPGWGEAASTRAGESTGTFDPPGLALGRASGHVMYACVAVAGSQAAQSNPCQLWFVFQIHGGIIVLN